MLPAYPLPSQDPLSLETPHSLKKGLFHDLMQLKSFFLRVWRFAAIAGPAMAADMPVAPPPPPVVYYDWTGAYIGFNAGGVWYNQERTFPNAGALAGVANHQTSGSEGILGFHAGAQWQWGAWVLGAEAALSGCFSECRSPIMCALCPGSSILSAPMRSASTRSPTCSRSVLDWAMLGTAG